MEQILFVNKKNFGPVSVTLKPLDLSYLDQMLNLQQEIFDGLSNKELLGLSDYDEFKNCICHNGTAIGVVTAQNELIALGLYIEKGYDESNYAYDLNMTGDDVLRVGQIECTLVQEAYRGNRLQKIMCEALEAIGRNNGNTLICATASPYNEYSVATFKNLGYEIKVDKLKYGGLRRYVFAKSLI